MTENTSTDIKSIDRKLSIVISLLLKIANNGSESTLKEQVRDLASFGLSSSEIADILGKKVGHVSKELSVLKKNQNSMENKELLEAISRRLGVLIALK